MTGTEVTMPAAEEAPLVGTADDTSATDEAPAEGAGLKILAVEETLTPGTEVSIPAAEEAPEVGILIGAVETVIGYTEVYDEIVSVVTWPDLAGQSVTLGAHEVIV